jgi:hypothetical protein
MNNFQMIPDQEVLDSMSPLCHARCQMIVDILSLMEKKKDLPLPNRYRLAKVIIEYWKKEGFREDLRDNGSKFNLTSFYINKHMKEVKMVALENHSPFGFHRPMDSLRGLWMFLNKKQCKEILQRQYKELTTRRETYMNELQETNSRMKYNIQLPTIPEFTSIEDKNNKTKLITDKRK